MATNNKRTVTEPEKKEPARAVQAQESTYSAQELAKAHNTFGTSYAIVATALRLAGKKEATITEAKQIIDTFKNKEVK